MSDFPDSERTRDAVTSFGRIAARTSATVRSVLARTDPNEQENVVLLVALDPPVA